MSIFAGIAVETLNTWLTEAQTALQKLAIGAQTVSLAYGDKRVAFTPAQVKQLKAHIHSLQVAIAVAQGNTTPKPYKVATWTR